MLCAHMKLTKNILKFVCGHHTNHDRRDRNFSARRTISKPNICARGHCWQPFYHRWEKHIFRTSFNECMTCVCYRANTFGVALVILTLLVSRETEPTQPAPLAINMILVPNTMGWFCLTGRWGNKAHITSFRKQSSHHKAIQTDFRVFRASYIYIYVYFGSSSEL